MFRVHTIQSGESLSVTGQISIRRSKYIFTGDNGEIRVGKIRGSLSTSKVPRSVVMTYTGLHLYVFISHEKRFAICVPLKYYLTVLLNIKKTADLAVSLGTEVSLPTNLFINFPLNLRNIKIS